MRLRYVLKGTAVLALAVLTSLGLVTPVRANHETIVIDGDLTDLIGAISRNATSRRAAPRPPQLSPVAVEPRSSSVLVACMVDMSCGYSA